MSKASGNRRKSRAQDMPEQQLNARNAAVGASDRWLRIIGGTHRGRKIHASDDLRTRPMKDRVREAVFNLVGPGVKDKHAVDLFAGTGALGFEALSRGAARATFFERHFPTAQLIRRSGAELELTAKMDVVAADTFIHFRRGVRLLEAASEAAVPPGALSSDRPWVVFFSPPWELFQTRRDDMLTLLNTLQSAAPAESMLVVEADASFDFALLADAGQWDVRSYLPALVGIRKLAR